MQSLYEQVYQALKQEILDGKYKIGDRVPSEKELSNNFKVSRITSKKALKKLEEDGIVYRRQGKGTFVAEDRKEINKLNNKKLLIGLVVTGLDDSHISKLISSIETASNEKCLVILKQSFGSAEREEHIIDELLELPVDGLIIYPAQAEHYSPKILKLTVEKYPLVLIDRAFKRIAATTISTDNVEAAKTGIDYLFSLGHQEIGVISPNTIQTTTIEDRFNGIVKAYSEREVAVNPNLWCTDIKSTLPSKSGTPEQDIEVIKEFLKKNSHITALFTLEYHIAILAKRAVEKLGLYVPKDISILCFDELESDFNGWAFTHLRQKEELIGQTAIKRLMNMINGECTVQKDYFSAELIVANSTNQYKKNQD
ncbi:GntR family transcriptional regulator [Priestia megaterium]|uniref:GntR family transcriptional regulator n=1 Tax=Priestia megaterium TaxID=1404 RepID=UPI000BF470EC|nr:GntR family transcriptional regulator [Priestia megaterium]PFT51474.1 GntR family transcriptional regulator [Priestia megaterium]